MMTYYDFFEEFAAQGVLSEDDQIYLKYPGESQEQSNLEDQIASPLISPDKQSHILAKKGKFESKRASMGCHEVYVTPEPQESQLLNFKKGKKIRSLEADKRSPKGSEDPQKRLTLVDPSNPLKIDSQDYISIMELSSENRGRLIKNIIRLALHLCHFVACEYLTNTRAQREVAFLLICLSRKMIGIKNFKNGLFRRLYRVRISDKARFEAELEDLETEFRPIFDTFNIDLETFDDGFGDEKEAYQPFSLFDFVEREYDHLGNIVSDKLEGREKRIRREKKLVKKQLKFDVYSETVKRGKLTVLETGSMISEKLQSITLVRTAQNSVRPNLNVRRSGEFKIDRDGSKGHGDELVANLGGPDDGLLSLNNLENVYSEKNLRASSQKKRKKKKKVTKSHLLDSQDSNQVEFLSKKSDQNSKKELKLQGLKSLNFSTSGGQANSSNTRRGKRSGRTAFRGDVDASIASSRSRIRKRSKRRKQKFLDFGGNKSDRHRFTARSKSTKGNNHNKKKKPKLSQISSRISPEKFERKLNHILSQPESGIATKGLTSPLAFSDTAQKPKSGLTKKTKKSSKNNKNGSKKTTERSLDHKKQAPERAEGSLDRIHQIRDRVGSSDKKRRTSDNEENERSSGSNSQIVNYLKFSSTKKGSSRKKRKTKRYISPPSDNKQLIEYERYHKNSARNTNRKSAHEEFVSNVESDSQREYHFEPKKNDFYSARSVFCSSGGFSSAQKSDFRYTNNQRKPQDLEDEEDQVSWAPARSMQSEIEINPLGEEDEVLIEMDRLGSALKHHKPVKQQKGQGFEILLGDENPDLAAIRSSLTDKLDYLTSSVIVLDPDEEASRVGGDTNSPLGGRRLRTTSEHIQTSGKKEKTAGSREHENGSNEFSSSLKFESGDYMIAGGLVSSGDGKETSRSGKKTKRRSQEAGDEDSGSPVFKDEPSSNELAKNENTEFRGRGDDDSDKPIRNRFELVVELPVKPAKSVERPKTINLPDSVEKPTRNSREKSKGEDKADDAIFRMDKELDGDLILEYDYDDEERLSRDIFLSEDQYVESAKPNKRQIVQELFMSQPIQYQLKNVQISAFKTHPEPTVENQLEIGSDKSIDLDRDEIRTVPQLAGLKEKTLHKKPKFTKSEKSEELKVRESAEAATERRKEASLMVGTIDNDSDEMLKEFSSEAIHFIEEETLEFEGYYPRRRTTHTTKEAPKRKSRAVRPSEANTEEQELYNLAEQYFGEKLQEYSKKGVQFTNTEPKIANDAQKTERNNKKSIRQKKLKMDKKGEKTDQKSDQGLINVQERAYYVDQDDESGIETTRRDNREKPQKEQNLSEYPIESTNRSIEGVSAISKHPKLPKKLPKYNKGKQRMKAFLGAGSTLQPPKPHDQSIESSKETNPGHTFILSKSFNNKKGIKIGKTNKLMRGSKNHSIQYTGASKASPTSKGMVYVDLAAKLSLNKSLDQSAIKNQKLALEEIRAVQGLDTRQEESTLKLGVVRRKRKKSKEVSSLIQTRNGSRALSMVGGVSSLHNGDSEQNKDSTSSSSESSSDDGGEKPISGASSSSGEADVEGPYKGSRSSSEVAGGSSQAENGSRSTLTARNNSKNKLKANFRKLHKNKIFQNSICIPKLQINKKEQMKDGDTINSEIGVSKDKKGRKLKFGEKHDSIENMRTKHQAEGSVAAVEVEKSRTHRRYYSKVVGTQKSRNNPFIKNPLFGNLNLPSEARKRGRVAKKPSLNRSGSMKKRTTSLQFESSILSSRTSNQPSNIIQPRKRGILTRMDPDQAPKPAKNSQESNVMPNDPARRIFSRKVHRGSIEPKIEVNGKKRASKSNKFLEKRIFGNLSINDVSKTSLRGSDFQNRSIVSGGIVAQPQMDKDSNNLRKSLKTLKSRYMNLGAFDPISKNQEYLGTQEYVKVANSELRSGKIASSVLKSPKKLKNSKIGLSNDFGSKKPKNHNLGIRGKGKGKSKRGSSQKKKVKTKLRYYPPSSAKVKNRLQKLKKSSKKSFREKAEETNKLLNSKIASSGLESHNFANHKNLHKTLNYDDLYTGQHPQDSSSVSRRLLGGVNSQRSFKNLKKRPSNKTSKIEENRSFAEFPSTLRARNHLAKPSSTLKPNILRTSLHSLHKSIDHENSSKRSSGLNLETLNNLTFNKELSSNPQSTKITNPGAIGVTHLLNPKRAADKLYSSYYVKSTASELPDEHRDPLRGFARPVHLPKHENREYSSGKSPKLSSRGGATLRGLSGGEELFGGVQSRAGSNNSFMKHFQGLNEARKSNQRLGAGGPVNGFNQSQRVSEESERIVIDSRKPLLGDVVNFNARISKNRSLIKSSLERLPPALSSKNGSLEANKGLVSPSLMDGAPTRSKIFFGTSVPPQNPKSQNLGQRKAKLTTKQGQPSFKKGVNGPEMVLKASSNRESLKPAHKTPSLNLSNLDILNEKRGKPGPGGPLPPPNTLSSSTRNAKIHKTLQSQHSRNHQNQASQGYSAREPPRRQPSRTHLDASIPNAHNMGSKNPEKRHYSKNLSIGDRALLNPQNKPRKGNRQSETARNLSIKLPPSHQRSSGLGSIKPLKSKLMASDYHPLPEKGPNNKSSILRKNIKKMNTFFGGNKKKKSPKSVLGSGVIFGKDQAKTSGPGPAGSSNGRKKTHKMVVGVNQAFGGLKKQPSRKSTRNKSMSRIGVGRVLPKTSVKNDGAESGTSVNSGVKNEQFWGVGKSEKNESFGANFSKTMKRDNSRSLALDTIASNTGHIPLNSFAKTSEGSKQKIGKNLLQADSSHSERLPGTLNKTMDQARVPKEPSGMIYSQPFYGTTNFGGTLKSAKNQLQGTLTGQNPSEMMLSARLKSFATDKKNIFSTNENMFFETVSDNLTPGPHLDMAGNLRNVPKSRNVENPASGQITRKNPSLSIAESNRAPMTLDAISPQVFHSSVDFDSATGTPSIFSKPKSTKMIFSQKSTPQPENAKNKLAGQVKDNFKRKNNKNVKLGYLETGQAPNFVRGKLGGIWTNRDTSAANTPHERSKRAAVKGLFSGRSEKIFVENQHMKEMRINLKPHKRGNKDRSIDFTKVSGPPVSYQGTIKAEKVRGAAGKYMGNRSQQADMQGAHSHRYFKKNPLDHQFGGVPLNLKGNGVGGGGGGKQGAGKKDARSYLPRSNRLV